MSEADDKLFRLISALDKYEKGFVKKYAALHAKEDANSKRLFDIYNSFKEYDREKIDRLLQKEKFHNHIHKSKNYLSSLILKALRIYYAEKKTKNRIKAMLLDAEILKDKKLFKEAAYTLNKAKKEAIRLEMYRTLIDICALEITIVPNFCIDINKYMELENANIAESSKFEKMEKDLSFLNALLPKVSFEMRMIYKKPKVEIQENINALLSSNQFQEAVSHDTYAFNTFKRHFIIYNAYIEEDYSTFKNEGLQFTKHISDPTKNFFFSSDSQLAFLNNLANRALSIYSHDLFKSCFSEIEKIKLSIEDKNERAYLLSVSICTYLNCYYFFQSGQFEKGLTLCTKRIQEELLPDDGINDNLSVLYFYYGAFQFCTGKYSEAIKSMNAIELYTNQHEDPIRKSESYLIRILSHIELNNTESALYIAKQYASFLEKEQFNYQERKLLLRIIHENPEKGKKEIVSLLNEQLENNIEKRDFCMTQPLINIRIWCFCHLHDISPDKVYSFHFESMNKNPFATLSPKDYSHFSSGQNLK
ncbi:MAG: hypothetical protein ACKOXB_00685 [Flavobacteriales bacterium]